MKSEILSLLRESDGYLSGQYLCEYFKVSRTAVWKSINQLKESGYEIDSVPNKGYRLVHQADVMKPYEIESHLQTKWIARTILYKESTNSTNTDVKALMEDGGKSGILLVADEQLKGRGRRGRDWETPKGTTISMTLGLKPEFPPDCASMLTLINAMSVARAIKEQLSLDAKIKWPNDIVIGGKKVCGILTEMSAEAGYIHYVVIGTGINANIDLFPEEIKDTATSLKSELGKPILRAPLIALVMQYFEEYYEIFLETLDLSKLLPFYEELLVNNQKEVKVLDPIEEYQGIARGIDKMGQLLVELKDGTMKSVYAGEVSVRGIYGYAE